MKHLIIFFHSIVGSQPMHFLFAIAFFGVSTFVLGQTDTRPIIEEVGVDEHLGDRLDLSLTFADTDGNTVALKDFINGDLPTVITPVYYSCPNLCTLVLNGVRNLINETDLILGEDYQILNVSFDPENTPQLASAKAANYYQTLIRPEPAREHWHYLTGREEQVSALMDAIGFRYKWANDQYSHASVLVLVSPNGKITRYIYGVDYDARDFRLSMVEASAGKVGSTVDKLLIYCFRYDPLSGKYVPYAWGIMRIGAGLSLLLLAVFGAFLWRNEFLNKRRLGQNV